ncbi:hypothetical protein LGH70_02960 [Hymenobacter sp. BT635]|uniref:Lipocalin-like domain-containing protein n=1 Tax=Hymenobacter nitidus TaxID=2880929 RepID=A0ABS8ABV8_9BACT|nr:hypothetical protein [Hymenobacter nitidus]MCB2376524.1 hypothetical protein [Hymenobacter nitidus]
MQTRTTLLASLLYLSVATLALTTGCGDKKDDPKAAKKKVNLFYSAYGLATPDDEKIDVGGYITIRQTPAGGATVTSTETFSTGWNASAFAQRPLDVIGRPGDKISVTMGCSKVRSNNTIRLSSSALIETSIEVDDEEVKTAVFNSKTPFQADGQQATTMEFTL